MAPAEQGVKHLGDHLVLSVYHTGDLCMEFPVFGMKRIERLHIVAVLHKSEFWVT